MCERCNEQQRLKAALSREEHDDDDDDEESEVLCERCRGCVNVVVAIQRFWRFYVSRSRAVRDGPVICASFHLGNRLKSMSEGLVSHIHEEWNLTMNNLAPFRTTTPRQRFGQLVANALIGNRVPHRIRNQATMYGRSASEPRIDGGRPRRGSLPTSRSLSPDRFQ